MLELGVDLGLASVTTDATGDVTIVAPTLSTLNDSDPGNNTTLDNLLTSYSDGVITLYPSAGEIDIDLIALLEDEYGYVDGLNGLDPNTEVVLNANIVNSLTDRITDVVESWTALLVSTLTDAINSTTIGIDRDVVINASITIPGIPPLIPPIPLLNTDLINVAIDLPTTTLGALNEPGGPTLSVVASILSDVLADSGLLSIDATALTTTLTNVLLDAVEEILQDVIDLGDTVDGLTGPIVSALASLLTPLSEILSLGVNVQPDKDPQPGAQPRPLYCLPDYELATSSSTAEYMVTALRVGLLTGTFDLEGCSGVDTLVSLATASAGPVTIPPPAP